MISQDLFFTILYTFAFSIILATGELLHHILKVKAEYTRKFSHSTATLVSLTFPLVYKSYEYVLVMGVIFFLVLLVAKHKDLLKSINDVSRKTHGSVLLPVAISGAFVTAYLLNDNKLFIIPMLILGISDSLAGIAGTLFRKKIRQIIIYGWNLKKTYLGSGVFFLTALAICLLTLHYFTGVLSTRTIVAAFAVALGAALVETFSSRGLDNFTVPLTALIILLFFL